MTNMRTVIVALVVILLLLQYKLWFSNGNVSDVYQLRKNVDTQIAKNIELRERNTALDAEVTELKQGKQAVEEHARTDLGMVKKGETFYQFIQTQHTRSVHSNKK